MKIALIRRKEDGFILGKRYEEPYRYSTYTSGGDMWWDAYEDIQEIDHWGDENFRPALFLKEEDAVKYINDTYGDQYTYKKGYIDNTKDYEVILLKDINV